MLNSINNNNDQINIKIYFKKLNEKIANDYHCNEVYNIIKKIDIDEDKLIYIIESGYFYLLNLLLDYNKIDFNI
jgi:hypothetical protein